MREMTRYVVAVVLIVVLAGCAAMRQERARDKENMLAAAGFQMKPADTPKRVAHLQIVLTESRRHLPRTTPGRRWIVAEGIVHPFFMDGRTWSSGLTGTDAPEGVRSPGRPRRWKKAGNHD